MKVNFRKSVWARIGLVMGLVSALLLLNQYQGHVSAQGGQQKGPQGNVLNLSGRPIGAVEGDGKIYNAYGRVVGYVDAAGAISISGKLIPTVKCTTSQEHASGLLMPKATYIT